MNIYKATRRLKWRVESGYWKVNKNDEKALTTIIDFINKKQETTIERNSLVTKLLVMVMNQQLIKYGCTIENSEIAFKQLYKHIEIPFDYHIKLFSQTINTNSEIAIWKKLGISVSNPMTEKQKEQFTEYFIAHSNPSNEDLKKRLLFNVSNFIELYYSNYKYDAA